MALLCLLAIPARGQRTTSAHNSAACGPLSNQVLSCPRFGFSYRVAYGWVDRTDEMQNEPTDASEGGAAPAPSSKEAQSGKSETLLAVFQRPPGAPGETINSAVVIAAESLSNYHGIKTAADYLGPISELAEQRGFEAAGDPAEVTLDGRQLVRADFSKQRGKLTMWQASLVMIDKGFIVSFTVIGGGQDEVDDLIDNLKFTPIAKRSR